MLKQAQDETGISIDDLLDKMDRENLTYKDLDEKQRKVYKAYIDNKNAQDNLKNSTEELNKATEEEDKKFFKLMEKLRRTSDNAEDYKKTIIDMYKNSEISAEQASIAIMRAMDKMDVKNKDVFTKDLPDDIKKGLDPDKYQSFMNRFTIQWNNFMSGLRTKLKIDASGSVKTNVSTGGYVVKMASGGLINLPGRGVPVSNAIARRSWNRRYYPFNR